MMKILLAIDGSEPAGAAVRELRNRTWPPGSRIRVLAVARPLIPPGELALAGAAYDQMTRELVEESRKVAARASDALQRSGLAVETVVREGDPRTEIVAEAERFEADLIILGSKGRTGVARWLMGSVAEYVVRHAPCSVEVARNPQHPQVAPGVL
ncbi:MAG TPA: universal stress protein [Myxococcaceae bacterium]|nr:universal stress protein [Myxococcaceae bacterium]